MAHEEMEERVFLLQDRLEAARIALGRRSGEPAGRPSVNIGPGPAVSSSPPSVVTATPSAPPRPAAPTVPELPVQRVAPVSYAPAAATSAPDEEFDEVVITMDDFQSRFDSAAEREALATSRAQQAAARPVAQPAVDTRGYSLPVSAATPAAARSAAPTASATGQSGLAVYRRALDEFNRGEYDRSIESLNDFIASRPEDDYMDNALFWLGECYYGLGRYQDALTQFQRVVSVYPDGNKVPDSLLKVALTYERLANDTSAREVLRVLVETYPTTDAARRAEERLRALQ